MLNKLLNIFSKNKKNIILLSFMIMGFFYLWDTTFAANSDNIMSVDPETTEKVAEVIRWIWSTITVFLSLLTYLAVMFLSPEWINGSLFGLNWYFKQIWILVSNVVYFVFAFILIWIAFMNIIWKWQDKYQLKQALPKFFIWIMIVPISWFLVNFILSISSILTISAINLPYDTFPWFNSKITEVNVPNKCIINLEKESWKSWTNNSWDWDNNVNSFFHCEEDAWKTSIWELMDSSDASSKIFSVLGTYAYGVIWLENIDQLNNFDQSKIKTILDLVVKLVFDILFIVVYAVLMIALALVLMTRWIYIWIYMMISPLFGLMYFFDKSSGWWEFFDKFNIKQFISLAMVPVYTMLALTFGLLFIFVVAQWMAAGNTSTAIDWLQSVKIISWTDDENESTLIIGSDEDEGKNFSLVVKWAAANEENISDIWQTALSESNWALWVIGTLIMKIFGIVVLWWAVMAALRTNEVTKAVVEPLHAFGTQVWQLATKSPQYAPIFGGQSMKSMSSAASSFKSWIEWYHSQKWADIWRNYSDMIVWWWDKNVRRIEDNFRGLSESDTDWIERAIKDTLPHINFDNKRHVDKLVEALESVWFENLNSSSMIWQSKDQVWRHLIQNQNNKLREGWKFDDYSDYVRALDWNTSFWWWDVGNNWNNDQNWWNNPTQNNNINISTTWVLSWLDMIDIQLSWPDGEKFDSADRVDILAENIHKLWKNNIESYFSDDLIEEIRKYYDSDWKFVPDGGQDNWKLPWEVDDNNQDEE